MKAWVPLTIQVTKPQAHLYAFCDFDRFHELKAMLEEVGWYVFRTPILSIKLGSGRVPLPEHGPRRQYEIILYAFRGKKTTTHIYPDLVQAAGDPQMLHGAQKPVAVYQDLLQRSVRPGDEVLDCFAGTGGLLEAAHTARCKATIIEQEAAYFGVCIKRLEKLKQLEQPELALGV